MPQFFPKSSFVEKEGRKVCEISPLHLLVSILESFLFLGTFEFCFGHKKNPGLRVPYLFVFMALNQLSFCLSCSSLQACWTNSNSKIEERLQTQNTLTCTLFSHKAMLCGLSLKDSSRSLFKASD